MGFKQWLFKLAKVEFARVWDRLTNNFFCADCGKNVVESHEYCYTVNDPTWRLARLRKGKLCVSCLESRLGRRLHQGDFDLTIPINRERWNQSPLLVERMVSPTAH